MFLLWFCLAWLIGIVVGDWLALPAMATAVAAVGLVGIAVVWWPRPDVRVPLLLGATFFLGAVRLAYAQPETTTASVWAYTGGNVVITGTVTQQPDRREDKQTAVIAAEQLVVDDEARQVTGNVLLRLPPNPELRYGQRVVVGGRL